MLHQTTGIVLHTTKFNDKTLFVHILTEEFGHVTYAIASGPSKKYGRKIAYFQPFSILDLIVEHKHNRNIHHIKESKIHIPLLHLQLDPIKIPISLFLSEFVYRAIKETSPNKQLFDFIIQSIQVLDLSKKGIANFHLVFLLKLTRFLGFYPNTDANIQDIVYFDMINGIFVYTHPFHNHYLLPNDAKIFRSLMRINYENMHIFTFSRKDRMKIIQKVIEYYQLHLTEFSIPKSLEVLHALFD